MNKPHSFYVGSGIDLAILNYYVPHQRGGGHIVFGADPVDVGVSIGIGISVTLSHLHDMS